MEIILRVLIINNDADERRSVINDLEGEFPYLQALEIAAKEDFDRALDEGDFDLVITWLNPPWTVAVDTLQAIKRRYPHCPVVLLPATQGEEAAGEAVEEMRKADLDDLIFKIVEQRSLLPDAVRATIKHSRQHLELKEAEERYLRRFDSVPVGLYRTTPGGHIAEGNLTLMNMLGHADRESLLEVNLDDMYLDPEDRRRQQRMMTCDGVVRGFEARLRRCDGTVVWIENNARAVFDIDGRIFWHEGFLTDITERKRTEDALKETEQRYRLIAESVNDVIWTMDLDLRKTYVSPSIKAFRGFTVEEAMDQSLEETLTPASREAVQMAFDALIGRVSAGEAKPDEPLTLELEYQCKGGSTVWSEVKMTLLYDQDGRPVEILGVTRDITDRHRMEMERVKVEKLESIGLLAGGIAHDFNNILTAILANISLARMMLDSDQMEESRERLKEAEGASLKAKDLTHQLLTFSKGGAPIKKTISIGRLLRESVIFALRGSSVKSEFDLPDALWPVEVDEGQIGQVINNLVINADQAMPSGGVIHIRAGNISVETANPHALRLGDYVRISIVDQGMGIPADHLGKVFDPYFSTKQKGSGLGLATSFSIIRNHDGKIVVESESGEGTTFTIFLPASCKEVAVSVAEEETLSTGQGKILIMDDDQAIVESASNFLEHVGYEVASAEDSNKTIEQYRSSLEKGRPFDVVIMDLTLPGGIGGKEVVKILHEMDPGVKAIVSSGYSNDPVMASYREYGFRGVIAKPYSLYELSRTVQKVIGEDPDRPGSAQPPAPEGDGN